MRYALRYILLFLTAVALQLFVFDAVNLGAYANPLVYAAFILLLPMNAPAIAVLLAGFGIGVFMDVFTGAGGIHTLASLTVSYVRLPLLKLIVGREYVAEGGIPSPKSLGTSKFVRYAASAIFIQCAVFFALESMNWRYFHLVLLKTALSGAITLLFVWPLSMMFTAGERKKA